MPRNLTKRYAPRTLEDLVGQDQAVEAIRRWSSVPQPPPLLLAGSSGTGKTTIARILGATYICQGSHPPCGECSNCERVFLGVPAIGYSEFNGAKHASAEAARQMTESIEEAVLYRWTTFVDEAHGLTKAGADVLLKPIEDPNQNARIILATTEPQNVRRTLRGRCQFLQLRTLSPVDLFALLSKVCRQEIIRFEPRALDMIALSAEGSARDALMLLDGIADMGDVTEELVRECLSLGNAASTVGYFRAVLAADIEAQDEALRQWGAKPSEITKLIRDFLLMLYNFEARSTRSNDIVNPAFFEVGEQDRKSIAAGFKRLAKARSSAFADFVLDLLEQWEGDPNSIVDRSSLMIKINRFDRLLHGDNPSPQRLDLLNHSSVSEAIEFKPKRKRIAQNSESDSPSFLSFGQAESIYEMASFLTQEHGVFLNTKISVSLPAQEADKGKVPATISQLTHSLAQRAKSWSGTPAHWIYTNSREDNRIVTRVGLHLSAKALRNFEPWVLEWQKGQNDGGDFKLQFDAQAPNRAEGYDHNRTQRHWWVTRWLAGALNPEILHWASLNEDSDREPLVRLLSIKNEERYRLGDLGKLNALGSSQSLGPAARKSASSENMPFLSAFKDCAWKQLQSGWELAEHKERKREAQDRKDQIERVRQEFSADGTKLEREAYENALAALKASWPIDPRMRLRSWQGWW